MDDGDTDGHTDKHHAYNIKAYLQLGQVGAHRLFEVFVKLRHLVAVTRCEC